MTASSQQHSSRIPRQVFASKMLGEVASVIIMVRFDLIQLRSGDDRVQYQYRAPCGVI